MRGFQINFAGSILFFRNRNGAIQRARLLAIR
jgi:hypothetical protein